MLVLCRKANEGIHLGGNIRVTVVSIEGNRVRLGIDAPKEVDIFRDDCVRRPAGCRGRNQEEAPKGGTAA